ncbi:protein rhomboid [Scaptodrosophila lebanonensis]|uniref:Protein rhomboid n=1 Tax=Drosophila lebanonensis TaxID=7225 RepID=A0A6J2U8Q3_DROLE|nr:protein rhomboid [Scaptodrosophila lebanonensis]
MSTINKQNKNKSDAAHLLQKCNAMPARANNEDEDDDDDYELDANVTLTPRTTSSTSSSSSSVCSAASSPTSTTMPAAAPLCKIFIDDLTERRRLWRVPWFIFLMCFLQITLHFFASKDLWAKLIFKPQLKREYWRFLSYMLVHSDQWHLWMNVILQCFIGICLELEHGQWRLVFVYVSGGVCGSLASGWLKPHMPVVGASGGVYAMLLSHIPHLVKNFSQLTHRYVRIAAFVLLCLGDVCHTIFHVLVKHNLEPRISLEAHVAGGVAGLVCGFIVYRRLRRPPRCCWQTGNNNCL